MKTHHICHLEREMEHLSSAQIPPCLKDPKSSAAPSEVFTPQTTAAGPGFSFTSFNFVPVISQGCLQNKELLRSLFPAAKAAPGAEPGLVTDATKGHVPRDATKGSVPVSLPASGNPAALLQGKMLTSKSTARVSARLQHLPQVTDPQLSPH